MHTNVAQHSVSANTFPVVWCQAQIMLKNTPNTPLPCIASDILPRKMDYAAFAAFAAIGGSSVPKTLSQNRLVTPKPFSKSE